MPSLMTSATPASSSSSHSSTHDSQKHVKLRPPPRNDPTCHVDGGGVASVVLSCCAPELRSSPVNVERRENGVRGSNVWVEKEYGKGDYSRQTTAELQAKNYPILGCGQTTIGGKKSRPFASTTLLDRNDSLVHESSLLSLIASEAEQDCFPADDWRNTPQTSNLRHSREGNRPRLFASTPMLDRNDSLLQTGSLLSLIASQDESNNYQNDQYPTTPQISYARYDSARFLQTSSAETSSSSLPVPPPPSPAMELSLAKRQASAQLMGGGKLSMRRELSRGSLFPKVNSVVSACSVTRSLRELDSSFPSCEEKSDKVEDDGKKGMPASLSMQESISVYDCLGRADPPPIWGDDENIHSELKCTYRYPRLFLQDPASVIGNNDRMIWWYQLSKQMDTTLSHVFDSHWQELEKQLTQHQNCGNNENMNTSINNISIESSAGQEVVARNPCSPDAIVDFLSNNTPPRLLPIQQQQKHKSTPSNKGSPLAGLSEISPINAWSEPVASTMKIRGRNYAKDSVKVESETALFSCLGVDSFVAGDGECKDNSNTSHYLERWNKVCEEVGLDRPPFLLVINFVVPWGSFQLYLFRPDADDGPFSSRFKDRPSEKALRCFLEGTTDYRNKCLKLIPRICAGPWVVKKMVGSTPAIIGTKLPVSYRGSIKENFFEISMDVTKGPAFGNTVANTVVGKADLVTVDLGFVIEGQEVDGTLPEQMLSLVRLHHLEMKRAFTIGQWREEVAKRRINMK
ncbi:hypothetical protein ACHAW6_013212 [Cyclotella cf. meneghiniana]